MIRRRLLGDATTDLLSTLSQGEQSAAKSLDEALKPFNYAPDVFTNYAGGMLRGWFRFFRSDGTYYDGPAPNGPGTVGDPPTAQEWAAFDKQAADLGTGGFVALARKHAMNDANTFDKSAKAVAQAEAMLDKFVPGWTVIVDLLTPTLPFLPLLTSTFAASAGISSEVASAAIGQAFRSSDLLSDALSVPLRQVTQPLSYFSQSALSQSASYAAQTLVPTLNQLTPLQATLARETEIVIKTRGSAIDKFTAAGVEAAQEMILAISIALTASAVFDGPVGPELALELQAASLALKGAVAGVTAQGGTSDALKAAGLALAEGAPALIAAGANFVAAVPDVANTIVGTEHIVTSTGVVGAVGGVSLGEIVRGVGQVGAALATAGIDVGKAANAAKQLRTQADRVTQAARVRATQADAEIADLQRQIAQVQAEIARLKNKNTSRPAQGSDGSLGWVFAALAAGLLADELLD